MDWRLEGKVPLKTMSSIYLHSSRPLSRVFTTRKQFGPSPSIFTHETLPLVLFHPWGLNRLRVAPLLITRILIRRFQHLPGTDRDPYCPQNVVCLLWTSIIRTVPKVVHVIFTFFQFKLVMDWKETPGNWKFLLNGDYPDAYWSHSCDAYAGVVSRPSWYIMWY